VRRNWLSNIEEIKLDSWEAFEAAIQQDEAEAEKASAEGSDVSNLLFRGQTDESWGLRTTLERYTNNRKFTWEDYNRIIYNNIHKISASFHDQQYFDVVRYDPLNHVYSEEDGGFGGDMPPNIEFMTYLRHHGFPTPLLDWTRSMYVAAFFAYQTAKSDVAIYTFRQFVSGFTFWVGGETGVFESPSNIRTHKRHHIQQAAYTVCYSVNPATESVKYKTRAYHPHVSANFGYDYNLCKKYILPSSERTKVLNKLDQMNINAFSLFGNEEGLMDMLAWRFLK
jgi:hypothetical protein